MNFNFLAISGLLLALICFVLTVIIIIYGRTKLHHLWALLNLFVVIWGIGLFKVGTARDANQALFFWKIANTGGIFLPPIFLHIVYIFCSINGRILVVISYALFSLFALLDILNLLNYRMGFIFNSLYYIQPVGPHYPIVSIAWLSIVSYGLYKLFKFYRTSHGFKRNQVLYFFVGWFFGFLGGATHFLPIFGFKIYPFGQIGIAFYSLIMTYAILRYRLMDIKVALTRAGIFVIVYTLVLGIPFWIGFKYGLWKYSTLIMLALATSGPLIYNYLRRRAESRLRAEEFHARELLTQAAEGMMRFRSIKKLTSLIVHVTCKTLKLDNAEMFLLDETTGKYNLEAVRLKSKYHYLDSLDNQDALIQRLSTIDEPIVYEEVKMQSQELKDKPDESIHEIERQMQALSAAVVIPASSRGRLLGFLVLGEKNSKRMYSHDDLSVLWALSYQAALAIENARFHQKAQEELLREDREVTSRFIGHGASHQFGNLLHRIIQRSEGKEMDLEELDINSLSQEDLKKLILELREEFKAITKTAFQGKDIVSGILSLGSGSPVEFKEEDLRAIITTAVSTIKLKQSKKTIQDMAQVTEIVTHITDNLPKIYCNSIQLEQVLGNLLDNDLEAIEEKENLIKRGELKEDNFRGRISIEAGLKDECLYLRIQDNGIGIKPEDQKKVFMPFFTTKATERLSRKGHGIGMHMVKEIIKAHQGKIYIGKTEYGKGTTFVMELPLKVSENKKV